MGKHIPYCCCGVVFFISGLLLPVASVSAHQITITDNFTVDSALRWRWQSVKDDVSGDAIANTLKARLSLTAELGSDLNVYAETDAVLAFNDGDYNSGVFNPGTVLIPEPQGAELNQGYLEYSALPNWQIRLGRQAISYGDERHISRVEFWQNDQTFDAISASYNNLHNLRFDFAWLKYAQRIFGNGAGDVLDPQDVRFAQNPLRPARQLGKHEHNTYLMNMSYTINPLATFAAYAWLIENHQQLSASSHTFGMQLNGSAKPASIKYEYELEWATQRDMYNNPWDYNADLYKLSGAAQYRSHSLALTLEKYGRGTEAGFQTPLGNNHKFLGWADVFNGYRLSPGLRDSYVTYRGRKAKLRWQIILHRFQDAGGDVHIGDELDIEIAYRYSRDWEFKLISANYKARSGLFDLPVSQTDTSSIYIAVNYNL